MERMKKSGGLIGLICLLFICFFIQMTTLSHAAEKFPTRPIKLVVPISAGGPTDVIARKMGEIVGKSLGQEIIIENRVGAGGAVGATFVAKSKPDGYTLGIVTSSTYLLSPFFTKMDFDPFTDLAPFVLPYTINHWVYVKDDSPIKTFKDFIEEGRKRQLLVGCAGMLLGDFALEHVGKVAKLNLKLMPLVGAPQIDAALLGGQVEAGVSSVHSEFIRSGKERLIVRLTEGAAPDEYKNVPHVREFGYDPVTPGFVVYVAPKGLPKPIYTRLEEEFSRAAASPTVVEIIHQIGEMPTIKRGDEVSNYVKAEYAKAEKMMKDLGVGIFAKEKK